MKIDEEDERPYYIKFLNTVLGWREDKILKLDSYIGLKTVENYLDAYAVNDIGLRMHPYNNETST